MDPDQTPHYVAFDLGLHFLPLSLLIYASHKWIKRKDLLNSFTATGDNNRLLQTA